MESTLIPEKPLLLSPSLAATIGLEEAILLALLSDIPPASDDQWQISGALLGQRLPFWSAQDIQRITKNLQEKGILTLHSPPFTQCQYIRWAFSPGVVAGQAPDTAAAPSANAPARQGNQISPNWRPDSDLMAQLAQYNIPDYFIRQQVPEFVSYWRERGEPHHTWGNKFLKQVVRRWREHETSLFQREQEVPVTQDWRPSADAIDMLVRHAGINRSFIEDAIPEFVLYWHERGELGRAWNAKFSQHVKRQWARYTSALEHDTEPRRLPENWRPSQDVFDILALANIDRQFALEQIPEFVLFWRESNRLYASWSTKFLQHVKYHWARRHALANAPQGNNYGQQQPSAGASATRDRSLIEDLTDRSWAN